MEDKLSHTLKVIEASTNYNLWLYNHLRGYLEGRVLDVGAGLGNVARFLIGDKKVIAGFITDSCESYLTNLEKIFLCDKRFTVIPLDISCQDILSNWHLGSIDTIICTNVLEHLEDENVALQNINSLLRENGKLLIIVPAFSFLFGSLDRISGHLRRYSKKYLSHLLLNNGFKIIKGQYIDSLGPIIWFMGGRVIRLKKFSKGACSFLDRFVPVLKICDKLFASFFGQSLFFVAEKISFKR